MPCLGRSGFRPWVGRPTPAGDSHTWLQLNLCDVKSSPGKHWGNIWSTGDMEIEKTVVGLAWTSSSFLTQERGLSVRTVSSLHAYQHPPLVRERRKREVIQFASGARKQRMQLCGLSSSWFLHHPQSACHSRPPCFISASGETAGLHFVLQNV